MINPVTGEFLTDAGFAVQPQLSEATFLATALGGKSAHRPMGKEHSTYELPRPQVAVGREWVVWLSFASGRLKSISLALSRGGGGTWADWSEAEELALKEEHDRILLGFLGQPPYQFAWGEVFSTYDPRSGSADIGISFK